MVWQVRLGWDRKAGEDLGRNIGLENVTTAGSGNSCPVDFIIFEKLRCNLTEYTYIYPVGMPHAGAPGWGV